MPICLLTRVPESAGGSYRATDEHPRLSSGSPAPSNLSDRNLRRLRDNNQGTQFKVPPTYDSQIFVQQDEELIWLLNEIIRDAGDKPIG